MFLFKKIMLIRMIFGKTLGYLCIVLNKSIKELLLRKQQIL